LVRAAGIRQRDLSQAAINTSRIRRKPQMRAAELEATGAWRGFPLHSNHGTLSASAHKNEPAAQTCAGEPGNGNAQTAEVRRVPSGSSAIRRSSPRSGLPVDRQKSRGCAQDDYLIHLLHRSLSGFRGVQTVLSQNSLNFGPFTRVTTLVGFPFVSTVWWCLSPQLDRTGPSLVFVSLEEDLSVILGPEGDASR
jgi:hypothetical protein